MFKLDQTQIGAALLAFGFLAGAPASVAAAVRIEGQVQAANNWNNPEAAVYNNVPHAISTWGGGSGFTIIYGVAAPVKAPLIGQVRPN
jgi:hypothetical protein